MTHIVDRLAELRLHLDHLRELSRMVESEEDLRSDLTRRNDVVHSLLIVSQLIIDVAGELCARRNLRFETYRESIRQLVAYEEFSPELVRSLARLPGFRNVVVHDYVELDLGMVVGALRDLDSLEEFATIVEKMQGS